MSKWRLFGWKWLINEIIHGYAKNREEQATKLYYAACLRLITLNTAKAVPDGRYMQVKLEDVLHPKPEETRSAEEIIEHIKSKLQSTEEKGAQE